MPVSISFSHLAVAICSSVGTPNMDLDHHYRTALDWTPNHIAERPVRVSKKVEAATRCLADSCHVADLLQEECFFCTAFTNHEYVIQAWVETWDLAPVRRTTDKSKARRA